MPENWDGKLKCDAVSMALKASFELSLKAGCWKLSEFQRETDGFSSQRSARKRRGRKRKIPSVKSSGRKESLSKKNRAICETCGKGYATVSNRNRHQQTCAGSAKKPKSSFGERAIAPVKLELNTSGTPPSSNLPSTRRTHLASPGQDSQVRDLRRKLLVAEQRVETVKLQTKLDFVEQALRDSKAREQDSKARAQAPQGASTTSTVSTLDTILPIMRQMQSFQASVALPFVSMTTNIGRASALSDAKSPDQTGVGRSVKDWGVADVGQFLSEVAAVPADIVRRFEQEHVTGMDLLNIDVECLTEMFGVSTFKAKSIMQRLEAL